VVNYPHKNPFVLSVSSSGMRIQIEVNQGAPTDWVPPLDGLFSSKGYKNKIKTIANTKTIPTSGT